MNKWASRFDGDRNNRDDIQDFLDDIARELSGSRSRPDIKLVDDHPHGIEPYNPSVENPYRPGEFWWVEASGSTDGYDNQDGDPVFGELEWAGVYGGTKSMWGAVEDFLNNLP